ncbi:phosphatidylinositol N-acetylglucosaminyltransferase subunit Q [Cimex lectularius]|uniref:Phosphatidylinositol N-acetylglucosaminyltransferase subunit Q n=1 Tax=Cimex lectularius TaxID=79782 RepID=A0A8I6TBG4_CIMLE|nr:phosphatidylinositol N-acetylglucosaminyltransferase subunit Q [Cimex lectularius]
MDTVLIFVPDIRKDFSGYLYGVYCESDSKSCRAFYILGMYSCLEQSPEPDLESYSLIGSSCGVNGRFFLDLRRENWVLLNHLNADTLVHKVYINHEDCPLNQCHVIRYSPDLLYDSELLLARSPDKEFDGDYFKTLVHFLNVKKSKVTKHKPSVITLLAASILQFIVYWLTKGYHITQLSSVGLHLLERSKNLKWLIESYYIPDTLKLQRGNFIMSILFDMPLGFFITMALSKWGTEHEIFHSIATVSEELVDSISVTLKWIMGSPGGLKLNYPLNFILGTFFLYHMYLWWIFLGLIRPLLELAFLLFLKMGFLGCSFQIALLADIFSLVSFHLYSIYVYAAKLFSFQFKQLCSLSAIFFGRKRNPEPGKVDSFPYNNEQLFVATVCFTVLLFLLPTTLVYYIIFTLLRLGIVMIGGLLTRARYLLEISPIYCTFIWFFKPRKVSMTIRLLPVKGLSNSGSVTLIAEAVPGSWFECALRCTPTVISKPKPVQWTKIGKSLLNGNIIYQI